MRPGIPRSFSLDLRSFMVRGSTSLKRRGELMYVSFSHGEVGREKDGS